VSVRRRLVRVIVTSVVATTLATCATTPRHDVVDPATLPSSSVRAATDWSKIGDAAFADLAAYLRVDTVNPPGNEKRGADFLAGLLAAHGIASEQIARASSPDCPAPSMLRPPGRGPSASSATSTSSRAKRPAGRRGVDRSRAPSSTRTAGTSSTAAAPST
jgi:hypothetical protein